MLRRLGIVFVVLGTLAFLLVPGVSALTPAVNSAVSCSNLSDAGSGCAGTTSSGGTVTSIATGFGLTGGPITGTGTLSHVAPSGDDQVYVSDSSSAATWRTLPNCTDSAGNHLNYTQSTNTFSCGTSATATAPGGSTTQVQYNSSSAFGGITNATSDGTTLTLTSPKIVTALNDTNGNAWLTVSATASAVNTFTVTNAATLNTPTITATGSDGNIGAKLIAKGTGNVTIDTGATGGSVILANNSNQKITVAQFTIGFGTSATGTASIIPFAFTGTSATSLTAGTERVEFDMNLAQTRQHASNTTVTLSRDMRVQAATHTFASSGGTITTAATLDLTGPPTGGTNSTLTTSTALNVETRSLTNVTNGYGAIVNAPTSATRNYGLLVAGVVSTTGTAPTLASCGSSPSAVGNDTAFTITGGTGATGCTASFSQTYSNAPTCQVSQQSMSLVNALSYTISTSAVTITQTGLGTNKLDVHCLFHD